MKKKNILCRLTAFVLLLCLSVGMAAPVRADIQPNLNFDQEFELQVSDNGRDPFTGRFLKRGNKLYVEFSTLDKMTNITYESTTGKFTRTDLVIPQGHIAGFEKNLPENAEAILRDGESKMVVDTDWADYQASYTLPLGTDDFIEQGDGDAYVAYQPAMIALCLNTVFDTETNTLYVLDQKNIWWLNHYINDIVMEDSALNMAYWRNDKMFGLEFSEWTATATDIALNLGKVPKYYTGEAQQEVYENEIWKIMLPTLEDETKIGQAGREHTRTAGYVGEMFWAATKGSKSVMERVFGGKGDGSLPESRGTPYGVFSTVIKTLSTVDTAMQVSDLINYAAVVAHIDEISQSRISGLEKIRVHSDNLYLDGALKNTLDAYKGKEDPVVRFLEEIGYGSLEAAVNIAVDEWLLKGWAGFAVNAFKQWSGKQATATLQAISALRIQDAARRAYTMYHNWLYSGQSVINRAEYMKAARDTAVIYLAAAQNAQKAVNIERDMEAGCQLVCERAALSLDFLERFQTADFIVPQYARDSEQAILNAHYTGFVDGGLWDIRWHPEIGGTPVQMHLALNGTSSAGAAVQPLIMQDANNGIFNDANGVTVATVVVDSWGVMLYIIDPAGNFELEIGQGEAWDVSGTVADCELSIAGVYEIKDEMWNGQDQNYDRLFYMTDTDAAGAPCYRIPITGGLPR